MSFEQSIERVLKHEGKYVNHPDDPGGETNYGITKNTALQYKSLWSKHNWNGDMRTIPLSLVKEIYKVGYWDKVKGDILDTYHPLLADHVFDFYVNSGSRAVTHLQEALNVLNNRQKDYQDIVVDGGLGNQTLSVLEAYRQRRGQEGIERLVMMLVFMQASFYIELSKKKESFESFTNGWIKRCTDKIRAYQAFMG